MSSDYLQQDPDFSNDSTPHILIVDDDASIRLLLTTYFDKKGYSTTVASHGAEAMALFKSAQKRTPVDVVLLDMIMPGMDGLTVRKALQSLSDVPILILSGAEEDGVELVQAGVREEGFIQKPFSVREVEERVRLLLAKPR